MGDFMTDEMRALIDAEKINTVPLVMAKPDAEQSAQVMPIIPTTNEMINAAIGGAIVAKISTDENIQKRFSQTADTVIENKLETEQSKAEGEAKEAHLKNNQDACDLYGIDEKTVPKWVVNIAKKVQDIWYAVWLIVGFFTTAPIVFLSKKIKVVCKKSWIAVALAIIIYVAIITVPIIIRVINK